MIAFPTFPSSSQRLVFDVDHIAVLPGIIETLDLGRVGVISTPSQAEAAAAIARRLVGLHAGTFTGARVHTPLHVTDRALEAMGAMDGVISIGGGSAIGLGKALSFRLGAAHVAIPTTYSGSERTPILGQTEEGRKTTFRDARVLPGTVIYDTALTLSLPVKASITSGFNALAHAFEALYAPDRDATSDAAALASIAGFFEALPVLAREPANGDARRKALWSAGLAGQVLGQTSMGLHHKLAHVLGGLYDLPHAPLHAALLGHVLRFNEAAAAEQLASAARLLGTETTSAGVFQLAARLGMPTALSALGLPLEGIERAVQMLMESPPRNPRPIEAEAVRQLLESAF